MIKLPEISLIELSLSDFHLYQSIYTSRELMSHVGSALSLNEVKKQFHQSHEEMKKPNPQILTFVIKCNRTHSKIGLIGLLKNQPNINDVEGGIMLAQGFHSMGYAQSAMEMMICYAFNELGVTKIIAHCFSDNFAANKLNKKMGFYIDENHEFSKDKITKNRWILVKSQ